MDRSFREITTALNTKEVVEKCIRDNEKGALAKALVDGLRTGEPVVIDSDMMKLEVFSNVIGISVYTAAFESVGHIKNVNPIEMNSAIIDRTRRAVKDFWVECGGSLE